jgi:hypothetical protein
MANSICVVGESGTGKSTSLGQIPELGIIGLDPKETVIINVMGKPLPFKGGRSNYNVPVSQGGNYACVNDSKTVVTILNAINTGRADIKNVVIDDAQYSMANEFMEKANKKGFEKFTEIALGAYNIITVGNAMRPDINFIYLTHSDFDDKAGTYKMKTIGKLLDEKVNLAGLFTVLLYTNTIYDATEKKMSYNFVTNKMVNNQGIEIPAKSPIGMFDELLIPNDLGLVVKKTNEYYG